MPQTINRPIRIGVIGAGECSQNIAEIAEQVGRLVADAQAILICGGRGGVMHAASKGAAEAGGIVVGILPSEDPETANPFVTIPIPTGMGNARNVVNVLASDAIVAIHGGAGTLSEIALASTTGTPLVGLHTWHATIDRNALGIESVASPEAAVARALELARGRLRRTRPNAL